MADVVDAATRSRMMANIRGRDTKPELLIRSGLHRLGFRFRLQNKKISGRPDLILPKYRAAIFVHGCFWHGHACPLFRLPRTRQEFWRTKILRNRERDDEVKQAVLEAGWRHLSVWECALRGTGEKARSRVLEKIARWLTRSIQRSADISGNRAR